MADVVVDLAFTPALLGASPRSPVVVLIDVLRATSTITSLFQLGARSVSLASGVRRAQALARSGRMVSAELPSGVQAPGCTVPVSPSLLTREAVAGQDVVFCTENGTRAARRVAPKAGELLIGCLLNASAAAERALRLAAEGAGRVVVTCAGRHKNRIPCFDDTYAAGVIVERACALAGRIGVSVALTDAARVGVTVSGASGPAERALAGSTTAAVLRRVGSEADIAFCARVDSSTAVPVLWRDARTERFPVILL